MKQPKQIIAKLIIELGFDGVAQEYLESKHSAVASFTFICGCLKSSDPRKLLVAQTALYACTKEEVWIAHSLLN